MDSMGEFYVNMEAYGWFPAQLPSEEGWDQEDEEDEHNTCG